MRPAVVGLLLNTYPCRGSGPCILIKTPNGYILGFTSLNRALFSVFYGFAVCMISG
jgi:hypothetical protein